MYREFFFFHAILVIKLDKSLNKLIKGFDVPTEQIILQQSIYFCLNYAKKEATVQPPAPVQPPGRIPYITNDEKEKKRFNVSFFD